MVSSCQTTEKYLLNMDHLQQIPFIGNRVFSHDVTAAMLVFQPNPVGDELFSYVNAFFCSNKFA